MDASRRCGTQPMSDHMDTLTVERCQDLFKRHGDIFLADTREVVRAIRKSNSDDGLTNSNYFHALTLTHVMLEHTSYNFRMLTGPDGDDCLRCLGSAFRDMISLVKNAGNKARVIMLDCTPKHILKFKEDFGDVFDFKTATASEGSDIRHFIVCDDDMTRIEQPHDRVQSKDSAASIKAKVNFSDKAKARIYTSQFDRIWEFLGA